MTKNIILIGFKCVGKSVIGRELARQIACPFIDLDEEIEKAYVKKHNKKLTCRQIMLSEGQDAFRKQEYEALIRALTLPTFGVLSLGGGAAMYEPSRVFIAAHTVIEVTAPKNIVFERIMVRGRPAFFSPDEDLIVSFNRIWKERAPVYAHLAQHTINNSGSVQEAVDKIRSVLTQSN